MDEVGLVTETLHWIQANNSILLQLHNNYRYLRNLILRA